MAATRSSSRSSTNSAPTREDEARQSAIRQSRFALLRYAAYHFAREEAWEEAREEKVMAACQYPEIREHKAEHRGFVERINHVHRRLDEGPEEAAAIGDTRVNEALLNFLQDWLKHHILVEDMAYRPHAEHSPAAREAANSFKATEVWWSR